MKIIRFLQDGQPRLGRLQTDGSIHIFQNLASVQELMAPGASVASSSTTLSMDSVVLLAPIVPQRNVICVGWNYLKHYDESVGKREGQEVELPEHPTLFTKLPTTVAGPYDALPLQQNYTSKLDWEVELAIVIGKAGKDIREEDALGHVFGYTVANDISARDLQRAHGAQWFKGKSLDHTCPLGPVLVTADDIPNPQDLRLTCSVNGEVMQSGHTRNQIFSIARLIAEISAGLTLLPGDVILTGTPDGIGSARTPPLFIKDGDTITCEIEGIGQLQNTFHSALREAIAPQSASTRASNT